MPRNLLILLFVLIPSVGFSQFNPTEVRERLRQNEMKFQAMVKAKRLEYNELITRAREADKEMKSFSAIVFAGEAQELFKDDAASHYIIGKAYARLEHVDEAIDHYKKAIEINPLDLPLLSQLVEINYFSGRYEEALKWIAHMEKVFELDVAMNIPTIFDFKKLVCLEKLESDGEELTELYAKYGYLDDTPFYYFSNALKRFKAGNREEGMLWIAKAGYVYKEDPESVYDWSKALMDAGYVQKHEILLKPQFDAFFD